MQPAVMEPYQLLQVRRKQSRLINSWCCGPDCVILLAWMWTTRSTYVQSTLVWTG